jgi:two-component system, OmpR family, response regulator VicR
MMAQILIVEDDKVLNDAYKLTLTHDGHEVESVFNGKEALQVAEEQQPDIILLDILMPEMSGIEFLEHYDLLNKHPKAKVVILSNIGEGQEVARAMALGAYKYIVKAHESPEDLSTLVNHLIRKNLNPTK